MMDSSGQFNAVTHVGGAGSAGRGQTEHVTHLFSAAAGNNSPISASWSLSPNRDVPRAGDHPDAAIHTRCVAGTHPRISANCSLSPNRDVPRASDHPRYVSQRATVARAYSEISARTALSPRAVMPRAGRGQCTAVIYMIAAAVGTYPEISARLNLSPSLVVPRAGRGQCSGVTQLRAAPTGTHHKSSGHRDVATHGSTAGSTSRDQPTLVTHAKRVAAGRRTSTSVAKRASSRLSAAIFSEISAGYVMSPKMEVPRAGRGQLNVVTRHLRAAAERRTNRPMAERPKTTLSAASSFPTEPT